MKNLIVSFSGGETSAYMTYQLLHDWNFCSQWADIKVVFANTGEEAEETLEFVKECDEKFNFNTVWLEDDRSLKRTYTNVFFFALFM